VLAGRLENVWVDFRDQRRRLGRRHAWRSALREITLDLPEGEKLAVIGGNGSGKTTLLRTIAGIYEPTRGSAEIHGRVVSVIEVDSGAGRDMTGRENLQLLAVLFGLSRSELRRRYDHILSLTGLSADDLDQPVYTYSAGMKLRLHFALAVGCAPVVLAVDETLSVADEAFQAHCIESMDELSRRGTTVVLASHDLDLVTRWADRTVVLDQGRILLDATPAEAVAYYRDRFGDQHAAHRAGEAGVRVVGFTS